MSPASDFLLLAVENGFLHFRFNLGNGEGGVVYNDSKIDDGKWHRIRASRYICYTPIPQSMRSSCGICHQNSHYFRDAVFFQKIFTYFPFYGFLVLFVR